MTAEEFRRRLFEDCQAAPGSHVLAAVSGGADSVALLCFLLRAREDALISVSCVHVEHGIRGGASMEDLAFVRALCEEKNVPFYAVHVDAPAYAKANGCGLEDAARTLRYDALDRIAQETGANAIALAHHADDQAETVLMHAARGSDVRGLCAMRARRGLLMRPLLGCTSQQLRAYLLSIGQSWREDQSNEDVRYARNRIRRCVMPQLEQALPGAGAALCRLADAAQRDEDYFERALDALDVQMIPLINGVAAEKAQLAGLHPALLSRLLVRMIGRAGLPGQSASVIGEIMAAAVHEDAVVNLSGGGHASIGERYLCLTRADMLQADVALRVPGVTDTPFGVFEVCAAQPGETGDGRSVQRMPRRVLDGARVTNRREGDVMTPFGRKTPVKLKKLMIDTGIERAMRASLPVIRNKEEIIFAVGLRPAQCCLCGGDEAEEQMVVRFLGAWPRTDEKDKCNQEE
ncbi:MAG: tRNA lysidine(34) synthetase TilS [Clostridia bacterium]|nr:tRNA lysidine(34) synthetase TilS [Clostridia bacterium]